MNISDFCETCYQAAGYFGSDMRLPDRVEGGQNFDASNLGPVYFGGAASIHL